MTNKHLNVRVNCVYFIICLHVDERFTQEFKNIIASLLQGSAIPYANYQEQNKPHKTLIFIMSTEWKVFCSYNYCNWCTRKRNKIINWMSHTVSYNYYNKIFIHLNKVFWKVLNIKTQNQQERAAFNDCFPQYRITNKVPCKTPNRTEHTGSHISTDCSLQKYCLHFEKRSLKHIKEICMYNSFTAKDAYTADKLKNPWREHKTTKF
jgi:predicted Fe-S protein YdhL (DUF1289 family)